MPRYFFDVDMNGVLAHDDQGCELPDMAAAQEHAMTSLSDLAYGRRHQGGPYLLASDVRDDAGAVVLRALAVAGSRACREGRRSGRGVCQELETATPMKNQGRDRRE